MDMIEQVIDSWHIHSRITFYLLDAIPEEALAGISASKGRSVGQMFAHVHNVRLMWLESAAPALMTGLSKIPADSLDNLSKAALKSALEASTAVIKKLLQQAFEAGKVKGFKPHPMAFYSYLIAHEWYHVGEIGMTLTQAGYKLDKKVAYGLWEWGVR
ncbi:MAG: DinB family protein [Chloroflexi bacterium]|nr:DinB family protein [Chloroflexota bacterium]MCC6896054.1 DinB family protein [Anaerolineae bacterium]